MRESWLANPYDSTAKANYLNAAQEASRVGFPGEVAAAQSQIDQFEASSEFNQEGYDQFLGLVESFGETGDLSFADQAAVLGQQLGLNSSTIDSMITRHITSQREVRQELAKGEWNEALDSAITTLEMGEELTEEEVDRLANFGVAAGMGTDTKSIVDNLYQRIDERREETLTDDVIRTTSALMDDPLDVRAGQAALAARMRQDPTQYSQTMQVIEELVSQGKQDEVDALVDQSLSIISPLESGNTERALKEIDGHISATQDPDEIQALQEMRQLIVDGKEDQVLEELILRTYAMGDSGVSAMEGLSDVREGTRRDTELEMRLIKMGTDLDLSQEGIDSLIARAKNDPVLGKTALKFLNYATAVSEDPNALDRVQEITLDRDVNKIWYDRTKHLVSVLRETDSVEEMAEMANSLDGGPSDANSPQVGVYDLALINTLQRLIDPATVREADITNMTATVGGVEGIRRLFNQLMSGEKFTPAQRRTMADVAIRLRNAYQTTVDEEIFPSVLAMSEVIGPMVPGSPRWKSIVGDYIPADQRPIRVED